MKKKNSRTDPFKLETCPVCGRDFIARPLWGYKIKTGGGHTRSVCSYPCMRKVQKEQEAKEAKK